MHFFSNIKTRTNQFQAFAEDKKYGNYEFSKSIKGTGSVRPFPHPSGKPFPIGTGTGSHPKPTFKPFPTGGHPKPTPIASELEPVVSAEAPVTFTKYATVDGSSGESGEEVNTINVEETPKTEEGKPAYGKPSGKPYFPAPSGKPFSTFKPHPSGGKPTFKPFPTGHKPITHHPFPTASGKPKPKPTPLVSESEPIVSTATVIPLPAETDVETEGAYKLKARFNLNARDEDDVEEEDEATPVEGESPPIVATSVSEKPKATHSHKSEKSGHAKPTGKPEHSIKSFPGGAHPTGGYAHPSGRPHHGHGGPSGFVTSKKQKTLTATKTGGKGKPTPIPAEE